MDMKMVIHLWSLAHKDFCDRSYVILMTMMLLIIISACDFIMPVIVMKKVTM